MAGHINQFLGTHTSSFVYNGALKSSQSTGISVYTDTLTQWLSQQITTASTQTTISYVLIQVSTIGGSPTSQLINPLTVSIYADSGGVPTGSALATTTVASSNVYSSPFWLMVPFNLTGLTRNTTYHVVVTKVGTTGHYYVWQRSNQVAGAHTSTNGTAWTAQSYGLMYQVYDQTSISGQVQLLYDDNGARIVSFTYNTNGTLNTINEYTVAQGTSNVLVQTRTINYATGLVTGVS